MSGLPPTATVEGLLQMIVQTDEKHEEAHGRLRETVGELRKTVDSNFAYLNDKDTLIRTRVDTLAATPVDAAKLVMTPQVVLTVVAAAVTIAGGVWASTTGLRSDVRDILTRMDAQQKVVEATTKLQEVQLSGLRDAVASAQRQSETTQRNYELLRYEVQGLKDVIGGGAGRAGGGGRVR